MEKLKLAIFISGRGSNMQAIIDACRDDGFPAQIVTVISNNPYAAGLARAEQAGISTVIVNHRDFDQKGDFEAALQNELNQYDIDLICLAGFMRILSADFINQWEDRIINIHPSLLPAYKGLNTHERALTDGQQESGCSVHYVVPEMDSGPLIVQKRVPIKSDDTPDTLAARILEQEHIAYPEAIRLVWEKLTHHLDEKAKIG